MSSIPGTTITTAAALFVLLLTISSTIDACRVNRTWASSPDGLDAEGESSFAVAADATTTCRVTCDFSGPNPDTTLFLRYGGLPGLIFHDGRADNRNGCDITLSITSPDDEFTLGYWLYLEQSFTNLKLECSCTQPGMSSELGCFSGDTMVQQQHKGPVLMKELKVGDKVLTQSGNYQEIYSFGHVNPNVIHDFYQIYIQGSKVPLEMTGNHLLYNDQGIPVRADQFQVGDSLLLLPNSARQTTTTTKIITKISKTLKQGVYLPLTQDGTIVVHSQQVVASNYISLGDYAPKSVATAHQYIMDETMGFQLFLAPYRMLCLGVSRRFCQNNSMNDNGILKWLVVGTQLAHFGEQQPLWLRHVCGAILFGVFGGLYAIEQLVGPACAPSLILATIVIVSLLLQRRRKKRQASNSLAKSKVA